MEYKYLNTLFNIKLYSKYLCYELSKQILQLQLFSSYLFRNTYYVL